MDWLPSYVLDFQARGGDEIFNSKASVKLGDEAEPTVLMNDPRDSRIV